MPDQIISLDIGSTYTKGALFSLSSQKDRFQLEKQASHPTTTELPISGVNIVLNKLGYQESTPIYCSSSAKGGLSIIALGIVPELTLHMAKITAYSAGGKITKVFDFKISKDDVRLIDQLTPDIILFAGGTDGGSESYNMHNANMLKHLQTNPTIIYAGNRVIADEICIILADKQITVAPNILPEIDTPFPDAARDKIREIFLKRIVECKGLSEIQKLTKHDPYPTPYSVFELVKKIPTFKPDWQSFCLIDMGGATTDFYSYHQEELESGVVFKGLKEPDAKRTVEGDLGIRVSATSTFSAGKDFFHKNCAQDKLPAFHEYVKTVSAHPEIIPNTLPEIEFDKYLADVCIGLSALRHAGKRKKTFTAAGECFLQSGKDLSKVEKLIGTGGFLSKSQNYTIDQNLFAKFQNQQGTETELLPEKIAYYVDRDYLIPLLANLSHIYPKASVNSVIEALTLNPGAAK